MRLPLSQWLLRTVIVLSPVLAVLASAPVGPAPGAGLLVPLGILALLAGRFPESAAAVLPPMLVLGWWAASVADQATAWAMVAAACLLVGQVASAVAGLGPPSYDVEGETLLLWTRRLFLLFPASLVAWLALRLQSGAVPLVVWGAAAVLASALTLLALDAAVEEDV